MQETKKVVKDKPRISKGVQIFSRSRFNIPHLICNHIIGKEHKIQHRITVGTVIMMIGVLISKGGGGISLVIVHYLSDAIGYGLHGIGLIPWIEYITDNVERKNEQFERNMLDLQTLEQREKKDGLEELYILQIEETIPKEEP